MRLEESQALQRATDTQSDSQGITWSSRMLSSDAPDPTQSEAGETLKAVERICQKCERDENPYKFPLQQGRFHALLVDFRTFLNGGDVHDRIHIGLGGEFIHPEARRYWNGSLISGVFNPRTRMHGAKEARERIHFLGFVCENSFEGDAFGRATEFIANPYLFPDAQNMRAVANSWPLQPARVINDR